MQEVTSCTGSFPLPRCSFSRRHGQGQRLTEKTRKLKEILQKLTVESETKPKPFAERVQKDTLELLIRKALSDKEINLAFEYAVYAPASDTSHLPIKSGHFEAANMTPNTR